MRRLYKGIARERKDRERFLKRIGLAATVGLASLLTIYGLAKCAKSNYKEMQGILHEAAAAESSNVRIAREALVDGREKDAYNISSNTISRLSSVAEDCDVIPKDSLYKAVYHALAEIKGQSKK